jgi:hypothetical protein
MKAILNTSCLSESYLAETPICPWHISVLRRITLEPLFLSLSLAIHFTGSQNGTLGSFIAEVASRFSSS